MVILGAGRPYRGEDPSALIATSANKRVLDWILDAFQTSLKQVGFHFVSGYRSEDIEKRYPNIHFHRVPDWSHMGSAGSLLHAPIRGSGAVYVCYADIVFRSDLVEKLKQAKADVAIVVDRDWQKRYAGRSAEDMGIAEKVLIRQGQLSDMGRHISVADAQAEYVGVMKLSADAWLKMDVLYRKRGDALLKQALPDLLLAWMAEGLSVELVEVEGRWAELNAPQDLARFILGTKADTLQNLQGLVKKSEIGKQVNFTLAQWQQESVACIKAIQNLFGPLPLVVRSSALTEDAWTSSHAGGFTSVLDVPGVDQARIRQAIDQVFASYDTQDPGHKVLVQAMLKNVKMSGVVFTRTLATGAPYYCINYDDVSADTASVTSGMGRHLKTCFVLRKRRIKDPVLNSVIEAVDELEALVGHDALDIEFAISPQNRVHIFQVRPIAVDYQHYPVDDKQVEAALGEAEASFKKWHQPGPFLLGENTCFGNMPDWNPAEIVGVKPRRLALSLYQYLITDEIWARQRAEFGYRDVRPCPLIVSFAGHPYVDVRASFNSFIPASLPDDLARRLVEHYLDWLERHPQLYDKVEFDVVYTCMAFDFDTRVQRLQEHGFTETDIQKLKQGLTQVTAQGMLRCWKYLKQVDLLEKRFTLIKADASLDPLTRAYVLLEDCRSHGTLAFAHLARCGFVAMTLLRSLVAVGALSQERMDTFLKSLQTVASMFETDARAAASGALPWLEFVARYGHLRPGTYEMTSRSYAEDAESYLRPMMQSYTQGDAAQKLAFVWSVAEREAISQVLQKAELPLDVDAFDRFLRQATEGREYSKFVFTRNLSLALDDMRSFGEAQGFNREQLSHVHIHDLLHIRRGMQASDIPQFLQGCIEDGQARYLLTQKVELPPIIFNNGEFECFFRSAVEPNFITQKFVEAELVDLQGVGSQAPDLHGKIALIPQADPGYDWLFGHRLAGLITMYGGANSHMAIRAAEFGLPAAIGVGESLYEQLARAQILHLDCATRQIKMIR